MTFEYSRNKRTQRSRSEVMRNNMHDFECSKFRLSVLVTLCLTRTFLLHRRAETVEGLCGIDVVSGGYCGGDGGSDLRGMDVVAVLG